MKEKLIFTNKILLVFSICVFFVKTSHARDFDILKEDYSYSVFKYVFENGIKSYSAYNPLEIEDVTQTDVEQTEIDMLCYRSDFKDRKKPYLGYAIISNVRGSDLSEHFSSSEQSEILDKPLFYVVAATQDVKDNEEGSIFDEPSDKFSSVPLELISLAEQANLLAFDDLVYRTKLNYRRDDNRIHLHAAYGASTMEPYGLRSNDRNIPLEIELHQFLNKVFYYSKHTINGWTPENKDLNKPNGLYYDLSSVVDNNSIETNLIRRAGLPLNSRIYAGKEFKLKRLSNNKFFLRIRHYHSEISRDQLELLTLYTFKNRFINEPYIDEYCVQR